jgi:hypothetical protein
MEGTVICEDSGIYFDIRIGGMKIYENSYFWSKWFKVHYIILQCKKITYCTLNVFYLKMCIQLYKVLILSINAVFHLAPDKNCVTHIRSVSRGTNIVPTLAVFLAFFWWQDVKIYRDGQLFFRRKFHRNRAVSVCITDVSFDGRQGRT